jgi:hypothetical protein
MTISKTGTYRGFLILLTWMLCGAVKVGGDAGERPHPPAHVRAERQDFQAVRITWDRMENSMKYLLYASYDRMPLDFHNENDAKAFSDNFVIWDAPRKGPRKFVFYITAVDSQGRESKPSKHVRVDLGPLPKFP